jgi:hypothetical protein
VRHHAVAVAGEEFRGAGAFPAAALQEPQRGREVVEGHHRCQAVLPARLQHPPVMVQGGHGKLAFLRLDPRPLQGKPVAGEAECGNERDVLAVPVVVVHGISGRLGEDRAGELLQEPGIAVDVVAFHLVACSGHAPKEVLRKRIGHVVPFMRNAGSAASRPLCLTQS